MAKKTISQPKRKAPTVITDSTLLGSSVPRDWEHVSKLREENLNSAEKSKLRQQSELEDVDRASGPRLHFTEVISRAKKLNADLMIREGLEGNIAIYTPRGSDDEWDDDSVPEDHLHKVQDWYKKYRYATGCPKDWLAEFSTVSTDDYGRPHREQRSWRTVIIGLVKAGALSYEEAVSQFGEPLGRRGWRWFEHLKTWKDNPYRRFKKEANYV